MTPKYPALYYFTTDGTKEEKIEGKEYHALGKLIAKLGLEGWEMVGTGSLPKMDAHAIYFKRPLP